MNAANSTLQVLGIGIGDVFRRAPYHTMLEKITCLETSTPGVYLKIPDHSQLLEESLFENVTSYVCQGCPSLLAHIFRLKGFV